MLWDSLRYPQTKPLMYLTYPAAYPAIPLSLSFGSSRLLAGRLAGWLASCCITDLLHSCACCLSAWSVEQELFDAVHDYQAWIDAGPPCMVRHDCAALFALELSQTEVETGSCLTTNVRSSPRSLRVRADPWPGESAVSLWSLRNCSACDIWNEISVRAESGG